MTTLARPMTTCEILQHEIDKLDVAIANCQSDSGVCHPWDKYRMSKLVDLKVSFMKSIAWLKANGIGMTTQESGR